MNYTEKTYEEIFMGMIQDAFESKLISHDDLFVEYIQNREDISNFYVMLLAIHSEAIKEVYDELTNVYKSSKVETATGRDLDSIGLIVDCSRPRATYASVELVFTPVGRIDELINIPEGVIVSTKSGVSYRTLEPVVFDTGVDECRVTALSTVSGVNGRVSKGSLTQVDIDEFKVTNPNDSLGGFDEYDDEQYRELLMNWIKTKQKGNVWAYKDYFARVDGIDDYKIIPNWDGTGTIKTVISPSTPYFLNKVFNELQSTVSQATEDIFVTAPLDRVVNVYIDCNVDYDILNPYSSTEKENIQSRIVKGVEDYVEHMGIGEDFIPHKLAVYLDETIKELKNISFNNPTEVIVLDDEEKAVLGELEVVME